MWTWVRDRDNSHSLEYQLYCTPSLQVSWLILGWLLPVSHASVITDPLIVLILMIEISLKKALCCPKMARKMCQI